jgi:tetratricopeptide (TPR) repeat protein
MSAFRAVSIGLLRSSFVALVALLLPGPLLVAAEGTAPMASPYARLLHGTAWVIAPDGSGSAWVADRERGLLVTNYHVVAKESADELHDTVTLIFPEYQDGRAIAEKSYYADHLDQLKAKGRVLQGRVIDASEGVDLAIIQVDHLPSDVTAVPLASQSPMPSDRLHSIGNPGRSQALWLYTEGAVKQVCRRAWVAPLGQRLIRMDARTVITQAPTNEGDSGGPVVNDEGQLVGVTEGASTDATLINCAIDVSEVRSYLADTSWMASVRTAKDHARRARHYFTNEWCAARLARHNRPQLALTDFDEAIRLDSSVADVYVDRAVILETLHGSLVGDANLGELLRAIADCKTAIRLAPRQGRARVVLADLRLAMVRRQAQSEFWTLPRVSTVSSGYAVALASTEYRTALATHKQEILNAVALDPDCIEAYQSLAVIADDPAQAIGNLNEIIRRQPDNAHAIADRAEKYAEEKQYDAALADLTKAIHMQPGAPEFYRSRASIYAELKQYEEAIADRLVVASRLAPEDTWNLSQLGDCLATVKHYDDAIAVYTEALSYIEKLSLPFAGPENILLARGDANRAKGNLDDARHDYRLAIKIQHRPEFLQKVKSRLSGLPLDSTDG